MLSRLENLLENTIAVNLLVTGLLAQLASYPQPLLRAFLLCTDGQNQPNVRTLYQVPRHPNTHIQKGAFHCSIGECIQIVACVSMQKVLASVRAQIERYVEARPEYAALVTQAWRFLLAKDQDSKFRGRETQLLANVSDSVSLTVCSSSECLQSQHGDIILDPSLPNGSLKNALPLPPLSVLPPCPPIPQEAKSRVFAIILYSEFLKELAAIAQEHSITADCSDED